MTLQSFLVKIDSLEIFKPSENSVKIKLSSKFCNIDSFLERVFRIPSMKKIANLHLAALDRQEPLISNVGNKGDSKPHSNK